jgi:surface antigen
MKLRSVYLLNWRRLCVLFAATLLASAGGASVAAAASPTSLGTVERECPDPRCGAVRSIPANAPLTMLCWRDAALQYGTKRWFRVTYAKVTGWVNASRIVNQSSVRRCDDLLPGEMLFAGQSVVSSNSQYFLMMQGDGNLVLYGPSGALWSSRTGGQSNDRAIMQRDGNLVIYGSRGAAWATGAAFTGTTLVVQSDSNVVEYAGSAPVWASSWHRQRGIVRGTNSGVSGNCTWYAYDRFWKASGTYPALSGDALNWDNAARATGWLVSGTPMTQAIVVFEPGVQGASRLGHVAWADSMRPQADGVYIHISEMNFRGLGVTSERWVKHVGGMSYIPAPSL